MNTQLATIYPLPWVMALTRAAAEKDMDAINRVIDRMAEIGLCAPRAKEGAAE